ncbi:MAG TPA: hypothetical protein VFA15_07735, partial [Nitrososphaera sp.]|nr:hypothetical protein [Nitrososphaera sp.]
MSRLEKIAQICIIAIAPLVVLATFPYLEPFQKIAPQVTSNKALLLASFFAVYAAILSAIAVIVALSWQLASRLHFRDAKSELSAQILPKSVPVTGGALYIEGEFSGRFMNGYLAAIFSTSAGRERVYWKYNESEDMGEVHGDRLNEPFAIKWNIPSSETA